MRASILKSRLLHSAAILFAAAAPAAAATQVTVPNANVLDLLAPFLDLNATTTGQQTLTENLSAAVATNQDAGGTPLNSFGQPTVQAVSISGKTIFSAASGSITLNGGQTVVYGPGANLAGGLPQQALQNGQTLSQDPGKPFGDLVATPANGTIYPYQPVGGLGGLGGAYQTAVSPKEVAGVTSNFVTSTGSVANPLLTTANTQSVVTLLAGAYTFTSSDLGVAKNYFANGTTNGTSTAVAPSGRTLPTSAIGGLPNTTTSVYDTAYGVSNTQAGQNQYGNSRPAQVAPSQINQFDPSALTGLTSNPSFPSGHTNYAFTDSILIGMLAPQFYQSMVLSGSEYGNERISLGVHYPLDIIASRAFASYDLAQLLNATPGSPYYYTNANGSSTVLNLNGAFVPAAQSLNAYLNTQTGSCGGSLSACAANNPYNAYSTTNYASQGATNAAIYAYRLNYGLPTTNAAPEQAPAGGPDASILLATLYGGDSPLAQALANAVTGGANGAGVDGKLATSTINQILLNTEGPAIAAFAGTPLSYWSRINLYAAAGYFGDVTGTLKTANGDHVFTDVTVGAAGVLDIGGRFTVDGNFSLDPSSIDFTINSLTDYSQLIVGGKADLEGEIDVTLGPGFAFAVGDAFALVEAAGGVTDGLSAFVLDGTACAGLGGSYFSCGAEKFFLGVTGRNDVLTLAAVPEPATWSMMLVGFVGLGLGLGLAGRRRATARSV